MRYNVPSLVVIYARNSSGAPAVGHGAAACGGMKGDLDVSCARACKARIARPAAQTRLNNVTRAIMARGALIGRATTASSDAKRRPKGIGALDNGNLKYFLSFLRLCPVPRPTRFPLNR